MKECYNSDNARVRPIRASSTQWIAQKIGPMTQILDKFGLYSLDYHLENVATNTCYRANGTIKKCWLTFVFISNV